MIRVVERAKKLLLKITIVGYIKALSPIVYNEEKCKRRERERDSIICREKKKPIGSLSLSLSL
jgi:hypothetical protein